MSDLLSALAAADEQYEDVEASSGFALHPVWKGIAEIEAARLEENKEKGQVQLFVKFKTEHGTPATWVTLVGFSDKNTEDQVAFSKKTLLAMGHSGSFADLAKPGGTEHLLGRNCEIQVKHNTWEGTTRENVYVNRAVDTPQSSAEAGAFAAQFNAAPTDGGDDIPF